MAVYNDINKVDMTDQDQEDSHDDGPLIWGNEPTEEELEIFKEGLDE